MLHRCGRALPRAPALRGRRPGCLDLGGQQQQQRRRMTAGAVSGDLDPEIEALVRGLHANDVKAVVYVTGGASQAVPWLLGVPGASNTVLEISAPYCRDSLVSILGKEPEQYCSESTALDLARAAYRRAAELTPFGAPVLGVAATCALASEPPKRGEHRAHVAAWAGGGGAAAGVRLEKGARARWGEDGVASRLLLQVFARAAGSRPDALHLGLRTASGSGGSGGGGGDELIERAVGLADLVGGGGGGGGSGTDGAAAGAAAGEGEGGEGDDPLALLLAGKVRCVEFSGGRVYVDAPRPGRVYLPGSFNPLHRGHESLLAAACAAAGRGREEGAFELSVGNADKGVLPLEEARLRVAQFVALGAPVVLTRAPLYVDKAALFPRSAFAVGIDTAARLVQARYYGDGSPAALAAAFAPFRAAGCSLLVAGRAEAPSGRFLELGDIQIPPELSGLLAPIPEADFRSDLSSTALRAAGLGLAKGPGGPAGGGGGGGGGQQPGGGLA
ncbi:hypothetical protein Rsub_07872 [Raphidocelis subcapitata]|uniref:Cytidyltransferase-like domain-containing protein n=1 Tax=Raphidocelis subcapitata TaxID=307507 RepID=A0A2V0P997_9CHLO|nr:hypothetical protein Rsub_07872 [Raphidocelis subcapitata]|eukprot:GBF95522.1 hypothetical protein Rsub_07872 [Raphidocelis subcapitata]